MPVNRSGKERRTEGFSARFSHSEIARVRWIRVIVFTPSLYPDFYHKTTMSLAVLSDSFVRHTMSCAEGLARLESTELAQFLSTDVLKSVTGELCIAGASSFYGHFCVGFVVSLWWLAKRSLWRSSRKLRQVLRAIKIQWQFQRCEALNQNLINSF
jgi:hypothetical protein